MKFAPASVVHWPGTAQAVSWSMAAVCVVAGLVLSMVTSPVGVSGVVFLLPVQLDVLQVPSPAITPTNLLFDVIAVPGACYGITGRANGGREPEAARLISISGSAAPKAARRHLFCSRVALVERTSI